MRVSALFEILGHFQDFRWVQWCPYVLHYRKLTYLIIIRRGRTVVHWWLWFSDLSESILWAFSIFSMSNSKVIDFDLSLKDRWGVQATIGTSHSVGGLRGLGINLNTCCSLGVNLQIEGTVRSVFTLHVLQSALKCCSFWWVKGGPSAKVGIHYNLVSLNSSVCRPVFEGVPSRLSLSLAERRYEKLKGKRFEQGLEWSKEIYVRVWYNFYTRTQSMLTLFSYVDIANLLKLKAEETSTRIFLRYIESVRVLEHI